MRPHHVEFSRAKMTALVGIAGAMLGAGLIFAWWHLTSPRPNLIAARKGVKKVSVNGIDRFSGDWPLCRTH